MEILKIGDKLPEAAFYLSDGRASSPRELFGGRTGALLFLRYAGCPLCCYDMNLLAGRAANFAKRGAALAVVLQSPQASVKAMHGYPFPFAVVCDPGKKLYRRYGVRPAASMEALIPAGLTGKVIARSARARLAGCRQGRQEGDEQQLPALFVVDAGGTVRAACYGATVLDHPDADGILALLDEAAHN